MLFELVIFAVVFVILSAIVNVVLLGAFMKMFTSKRFVKGYARMMFDVTNEVTKAMEELEGKES